MLLLSHIDFSPSLSTKKVLLSNENGELFVLIVLEMPVNFKIIDYQYRILNLWIGMKICKNKTIGENTVSM